MLFRPSPQPGPRSRQRGAVFLVCLFLVALLSLTASSFTLASHDAVEIARDQNASLQAELLAESAVAYSLRQFTFDPEWQGTGAEGQAVGAAGSFAVEMLGPGAGGGVLVRMSGSDGLALAMLQAELAVGGGGPGGLLKSCGLVTLGGDVDTNNLAVRAGNMLIVDAEDGVLDYDAGADDWLEAAIDEPEILANNVEVEGTLYTYLSELDGIEAEQRATVGTPVRTPKFDLDAFLVPNENVLIKTTGTLKNISTDKTVVVNVPAGTHISISDCDFRGGLVVYSESDYAPRGAPRNTMEWKKSSFGAASATGAVAKLGVLAPAAHVTHSHTQNSGYGLFYLKSADHFNAVTITAGALVVADYVQQMNNVEISYDETIWDGQFDAYLDWGVTETALMSIQEYYPEQ